MTITNPHTKAWGGMYEKVREYLVERSSIFGFIRWYEVVHTDRFENSTQLIVSTMKPPQKVFINGIKYVPAPTPKDPS